DETLTFKVIEFNRDDKRIIVSHTRYLEDIRKEADQMVQSEKVKEKEEVKKSIKTTQSKVELSTFGDIEGFSELKEQMAAAKPVAEAPKPEAPKAEVPAEKPAPAAKAAKPDDLKKIEGIGPKIEELLHNAEIMSFADLAKAEVSTLKDILNAAGSRYQMHDPTSWPMQSEMAANGEWDKLKEWQDNAKGGKIEE
ncbi:MAG TPA: hypothetical protein PLC27_01775, partial [Saprospiraceae bacterium]|nr:hypothetical protein [Saprospiraceae bacterium]